MGFEEELKREREDRKKSLEHYFSNTADINKGIASDIVWNVPELAFVNKKGKEIKEKLEQQKGCIIQLMASLGAKLTLLSGKLEEKPNSFEKDSEAARYGYEQIYSADSNQSIDNPNAKEMREYNNLTWQLCDAKNEIKAISTIISNIKEEKEYKLPINISTQLGF